MPCRERVVAAAAAARIYQQLKSARIKSVLCLAFGYNGVGVAVSVAAAAAAAIFPLHAIRCPYASMFVIAHTVKHVWFHFHILGCESI